MHIFDRATRFYGGNAIVGGGLPLAIGIALGDKMQGRNALTACFFGDGAVEEGEFHESMNLAALWQLPVLFVCENNLYAMGMAVERAEAETDIARKAAGYRMPASRGRRHGRGRGRGCGAATRSRRSEPAAGRNFSNAGPIASAPIRCSMPSSIAPRTRSRPGASKGPIARFAGLAAGERPASMRTSRPASRPRPTPRSTPPSPSPRPAPSEPVEELERFVTMDRVPT